MKKQRTESLTSQAVRGSVWDGAASLIQKIGGLVFTIVLARVLLPEGFGLYNLVLSIALLFAIVSQEGIHKSLIRYVSEALKKHNKHQERAYFRYISKIKFFVTLGVAIALLVAAYPLAEYVFKKPEMFIPLLLAALYIFIASFEMFFSAFFFAVRRFKYAAYKETIFQISRVALVVAFFFFIYSQPSVSLVFLALAIAAAITLVFAVSRIHLISPHVFSRNDKVSEVNQRRIINFSVLLTFSSVSFLFLGNIDTLMLGLLLPDTTPIGFYRAAFVIVSSVAGLLAFNKVLLPVFVQVQGKRLEHAFNTIFRYSMIISIPAAFGLAALANYFLVLIYGHEYLEATLVMYILSFMIIFVVQNSLFVELFSARERPRDYLPLLGFTVVLNIVLNYILISWLSTYSLRLGITGAAIATVLSWVIYTVGITMLARKKLGVQTQLGAIIAPLVSSVAMVLVIAWLRGVFGQISLVTGMILVVVGFVVYVAMMILTRGVTKTDWNLIRKLGVRFLFR